MNRVALRMLTGDRAKYIGILIGLTFASLLITQQSAIYDGLLERSYASIGDTGQADIWVMDPMVDNVDDIKPMQDTVLERVRSIPGVDWALPMFRNFIRARLDDGSTQNCIVLGLDDTTLMGGPPEMVEGRLEDLRRADGIIVDERDVSGRNAKLAHPPLAPGGAKRPLRIGDVLELNDHRTVVVGICRTHRSFMWNPFVYTTYDRARTWAPPQRKLLSYVIAKARAGEDPQRLCERIHAVTGMKVLTAAGFKRLTLDFIMENTGIPINFKISMFLGFLVGAVIAGQMFYNFTHDNLRHFGALKAMGAGDGLLLRMILIQALLVGFIGYGLGVGAAALFGNLVSGSELAFLLSSGRLLFSACVVLFICALSAVISIRKVIRLEPAVVFRS
jgi:putative ABC transport system permease protein